MIYNKNLDALRFVKIFKNGKLLIRKSVAHWQIPVNKSIGGNTKESTSIVAI